RISSIDRRAAFARRANAPERGRMASFTGRAIGAGARLSLHAILDGLSAIRRSCAQAVPAPNRPGRELRFPPRFIYKARLGGSIRGYSSKEPLKERLRPCP